MCKADKLRFWSYVDKTTGCWLWTGTLTLGQSVGYGSFNVKGKIRKTHRIAWELLRGPIPAGMKVLHRCPGGSNRACCNPAHLYLGTQKQNMEDRDREGRTAKGTRSGAHTHPERRPTGVRNGRHTKPECTARGDRSGRRKHPEAYPSKFTPDEIRLIFKLREAGNTQQAIADKLGCTQSFICNILRGRYYAGALQ